MSIYKTLIIATVLSVFAVCIGGLYYPESLAMSQASTSMTFTVLRIAICVLLIGLLLTNPPRSVVIRSIVGVASLLLVIMTTYLVMNFQMFLLDAVLFLEVAVIFAIEAFESRKTTIPVWKKPSSAHKIPVYTN